MKKSLLATICLVAAGFGLSAAVLSPSQALQRAISADQQGAKRIKAISSSSPELIFTRQTKSLEPAVYVFGIKESGFMIVAADDATESVLGYSDNGSFDPANIPPALAEMLDEYAAQISWARQHPGVNFTAARPDREAIAPMVSTKWNQSAPFNNACPTVNGKQCVTGCVATALAQLVNYHKWPQGNGVGTASYTWNGQTLSFDYANTTFDWENMLDRYETGKYNDTQVNAVATLMYACGVGVQMNYNTGASGAVTSKGVNFLIKNLDYNKGIHTESRAYYYTQQWEDLVYSQLRDFGPVQFSAQSNSSGHSFICDGYSSDGFFHINWGWGGMSDGYFLLSAMDPGQQGIGGSTSGYNFSQAIIADVRPSSTDDTPYMALASRPLNLSTNECTVGSYVKFIQTIFNIGADAFTGNLGAQYVNVATGDVFYKVSRSISLLNPNYGYSSTTLYAPSELEPGTYMVSLVFQLQGQTEWQPVLVDKSGAPYVLMTIADGKAYFELATSGSVKINNITPVSKFFVSSPFAISATVVNDSELEYNGIVSGILYNSDGDVVATTDKYPLFIESGASVDITYSSKFTPQSGVTLTTGDYFFAFIDDSDKHDVSDKIPVTLEEAPASTSFVISDLKVVDNYRYSDHQKLSFTANVTCTEGYYAGNFKLCIFPYIIGQTVYAVAQVYSQPVYLSAGETAQLVFKYDLYDSQPGEEYFTRIYDKDNTKLGDSTKIRFTLDSTSGVSDIQAASYDIVSVEVFTLSGVAVGNDLNALAPGQYVVRKVMSDGSVTVEKLVK